MRNPVFEMIKKKKNKNESPKDEITNNNLKRIISVPALIDGANPSPWDWSRIFMENRLPGAVLRFRAKRKTRS